MVWNYVQNHFLKNILHLFEPGTSILLIVCGAKHFLFVFVSFENSKVCLCDSYVHNITFVTALQVKYMLKQHKKSFAMYVYL